MIHAQASSNQQTLSLPDQINSEHPPQEEKEKDNNQNIYPKNDEEETKDCPLASDHHLPMEKSHPIPEQPKERNQQVQKQNPLRQSLNFFQSSEKTYISFNKIHKLPKPSTKPRLACSLPHKNLLLILLQDGKTVNIYNTMNFNLVAVRKVPEQLVCMSYSKQLRRIIVGGVHEFLQLWSPRTFKAEVECMKRNNNLTIQSVAYDYKSFVIVAKLNNQIRIYDAGLKCLADINISVYSGPWYPKSPEILSISKDLFLTFCIDENQKKPILVNIKTKSYTEFSKQVYIPLVSCVEMTENNPSPVFSCLGMFNKKPEKPDDDRIRYRLIQFTIDIKMNKIVPLRSSDILKHAFMKLNRIENSKYYLAENFGKCWNRTCLLSIEKDQIEILRFISNPSPICLNKVNIYMMTKDGKSMIEANDDKISVYRSVVYRT